MLHAGIQAFEIMAIAAVGNNLITYVFGEMHFPLSQAANVVTNFVGTIFLLSLLGGFLSDSYLGCFWTMLIFGFVELSVHTYIHPFTSSILPNVFSSFLRFYNYSFSKFKQKARLFGRVYDYARSYRYKLTLYIESRTCNQTIRC